jgi:Spy/CpxP family protein refolding chaperone
MAKTWQVVLATLAIFVAGLVTGGATALGAVRWIAHHPRASAALGVGPTGAMGQRGQAGQPAQSNLQFMRGALDKLDLTPEQRAKVGPIVRRAMAQLNRERREVQLTSALLIERMQDDVADVLTAAQRAKFEDLIGQQRARLQQFRRGIQQQQPPGDAPVSPDGPK